MDATTREALGFPDVLRLLAQGASSRLGERAILALEPAWDFEAVQRRLLLMEEVLRLEDGGGHVPLGGIADIGEILAQGAIPDAVLGVEAWPAIRDHLLLAGRCLAFAAEREEDFPRLSMLCGRLAGDDDLARAIDAVFDADGLVRDDASPELARLRSALRKAEAAVRTAVGRIIGRLRGKDVLQDEYSTMRNGRHVVPVRAGARGRIQGILHGASASGETLFIEPLEVLEPANEAELLRDREEREVERILRALTARLLPWAPAGMENLGVLGRLDLLTTLARLAGASGWKLPVFSDRGALRLFVAHHPLIQLRTPAASVPVNLSLNPGDATVLITGPNAGGKTTSMRTAGLLVALLQSGCPIPASPDSHVPLVHGIHADIGDAQNLAQGVSTFSGHVRRLNAILSSAEPGALVLLDELGTGTDPEEGAALAQAILEELLRRDVLTIATSHLGPLKAWAEQTPRARNASFSLDPHSRRPSFRLALDLPGASEAFQIAENEGLPPAMLARARELVGTQQLKLGELLMAVQERERRLAAAAREAEARASSLEAQEKLAAQRADLLRVERRESREKAAREREAAVQEVRARLEKLIAELPGPESFARRKAALLAARDEARAEQAGALSELESLLRQAGEAVEEASLRPGGRVFVRPVNAWGEVLAPPDESGKVRLRIGTMHASVRAQDLSKGPDEGPLLDDPRVRHEDSDEPGAPTRKQRRSKRVRAAMKELAAMPETTATRRAGDLPGGVTVRMAPRPPLPLQLDLHGYRVMEALETLSKYLDDAILANYPYVRVIHGTGEGKLYRAVHRYLRGHRAVEKYRFGTPEEGGGGVTVVEF